MQDKSVKDLILMGSSIFELWGTPNLPNINTLNIAIGGTTTQFWRDNVKQNMRDGIYNYALYCGSNDLNGGVSHLQIIANTNIIFDIIKSIDKRIQIAYFSIMKAPQKQDKFTIIDKINASVKLSLDANDIFVDLNQIINTNPKWYIEDNLHLTEIAYTEIENKCANILTDWVI